MYTKRIIVTGFVAAGLLTAGVAGIASAATANSAKSTTGTVGSSTIPKTVFRDDRLNAEAKVLNTTTDAVKTAHKDKTFKDLLTKAGLTKKTFDEKVKAELTSELKAQGYSQDQITIALQHKHIEHLQHEKKR